MKIFPSLLKGKTDRAAGRASPSPEEKIEIVRRFFDCDFYRSQLGGENVADAAMPAHYLEIGASRGLSPHPLFSTSYYLQTYPDVAADGINPLLHYLLYGCKENRRFHPLFDNNHYAQRVGEQPKVAKNWALHYLNTGRRKGVSPHRFFDPGYYKSQCERLTAARKKLAGIKHDAPAPLQIDADPFLSYLKGGWRLGLNPNRFFDVEWYQSNTDFADEKGMDPLSHYVMRGYRKSPAFHPAFNTRYYERQAGLAPGETNQLLHFLQASEATRCSPNPFLDSVHYVENNTDIKEHKLCPHLHFVSFGCQEPDRQVNRFSSKRYVYSENRSESLADTSAYVQYFKSRHAHARKRLVFVGHEASRTGAPLILLQLMKHAAASGRFDIFLILGRGGDLEAEYQSVAHTLVMGDKEPPESVVRNLLDLLDDDPPVAVIANSVETRKFAAAFGASGIPATMLVHEMMNVYYNPAEAQEGLEEISKIVFPAEFVRKGFLQYLSVPVEKTTILPQGLLNPAFGVGVSREVARDQIFEELSLPRDAFLVIGCGTVDFRKGVDYFVQTAKRVIANASPDAPVYFIWVGRIPSYKFESIYYWIQYELKKFSLEHRVRFAGETTAVEDYFAAADLFLLTSRADPFPCVCHEAMASDVPVVAFEESGGMPDVIRDGAGFTVPFGDTNAMADVVLDLMKDDGKRKAAAARGKVLVRERYNFKDYAEKVLQVASAIPKEKLAAVVPARERIKVYFSACDWEISGVNTQVVHLVEGLNKRGFDAKVLFTRGRFTYYTGDKLRLPDIPSVFVQPDSTSHWDVWKATQAFLEEQAPCVYVPNYDYVASAISPGLHNRVAIVGIAHSDDTEHYEHVHRLGAYWNRIVTVSDQVLEGVGKINPAHLEKSVMIPYGIPVGEFAPRRQREYSAADPIRLIYLGRFVRRQKRIYDYVALAKTMEARGIPFRMTMVGDGIESAEVARQLGSLVNSGRVVLPGRLEPESVKKLLDDSDVLLLLSDFEGLPLALLEAMERGCVPVAYEIKSGIRMIVREGSNGLIVPHGRVDKVADAVAALVDSPGRFHQMSQQARADFAGSQFTDDAMCDRYAALLQEVTAEVLEGRYFRPRKLFTLYSKLGNILPPPSISSV